jgi:glutamine synthetase
MSRWIDVTWVDLLGRPHVERAADLTEPITVPKAEVMAGFGGWSDDDGYVLAVPDPSSRRGAPGGPDVVMADLHDPDGEPSPLCSRSALRRVLGRAAAEGYDVSAAAELEFFLIDPSTRLPIYREIENYSIVRGSEIEPVMRRVRTELTALGIRIEATNPEYSGGQVEVNFRHGPALRAADDATLLRSLVRNIARSEGLDATFMAKPWNDQAGSGMHVHQSVWAGARNVFFEDGCLSARGRAYIAGLLDHMAEFALFGSLTPNAYHRRADFSFAPTVVCWGGDNRTVAVRAIEADEGATRIEQRDAAADCNVYLTFAGQFAAGLEGMRRMQEPPPAVEGDAYARHDLPMLPRSFREAYDLLRHGRAKDHLGPATVEAFLEVLEPELEIAIVSVADWERDRYMASV